MDLIDIRPATGVAARPLPFPRRYCRPVALMRHPSWRSRNAHHNPFGAGRDGGCPRATPPALVQPRMMGALCCRAVRWRGRRVV